MSKRGIKDAILLIVFAIYIYIYRAFVFTNHLKYSEIINVSFLFVFAAVSVYFLGYRKYKSSFDSKNITKTTITFMFLAFVVMYGLGLAVGFLRNAYSRNFLTLLNNILMPIFIIILIEFIRYVVLWANKDKKFFICLFTMVIIAFELAISIRSFPDVDAKSIFSLIATVVLPIVIKNSVMSYLCYHIGYKVPMLYRLIMDVYLFIIPIVPDIGDYLNSMILIALPGLIYINSYAYIEEREKEVEHFFQNERFSWWDIPIAVFIIGLAALVSGFFPIYMIGVGSDSMNPAIKKGDAVIIEKINDSTKIKENLIIAYEREDNHKVIIHRVKEVTTSDGEVAYVTKGDANNTADSNVVYRNQIRGIVKVKIPFIAYPTVWLSETFSK